MKKFALLSLFACTFLLANAAHAEPYGQDFWGHWGDGKAEISSYRLRIPRYGEEREGTVVLIYVTETFSNSLRVKADPGRHPKSDEFPVIKLNLVKDFPTGIYDYNLMLSSFIALQGVNERQAGEATKFSFSSQEWCGHVYAQTTLSGTTLSLDSHSYFDGEADEQKKISFPKNAVSEDALFLWARGLAYPFLQPGEKREVAFLRSLEYARLRHRPLELVDATLSRSGKTSSIATSLGSIEVETFRVETSDGYSLDFLVEKSAPRRLVRWRTSEGEQGELVKSERLPYWQLNSNAGEKMLPKIGLSPRPPLTP